MRFNKGKTAIHLLPPEWERLLADVLGAGAEKYEPENWRLGMTYSSCYAAARRHMAAWYEGEETDPETGLSHLGHAAWNTLALYSYQTHGVGEDDRFIWPDAMERECGTG